MSLHHLLLLSTSHNVYTCHSPKYHYIIVTVVYLVYCCITAVYVVVLFKSLPDTSTCGFCTTTIPVAGTPRSVKEVHTRTGGTVRVPHLTPVPDTFVSSVHNIHTLPDTYESAVRNSYMYPTLLGVL